MNRANEDARYLIVGPAKSGTTALTYAVAAAVGSSTVMFEEPPEMLERLPAGGVAKVLYDHFDEQRLLRGAALASHRMLLVRDPRDLFISRLLYALSARRDWLGDEALMHRLLRMLWDKQQSPEEISLRDVGALLYGSRQEAVRRLMAPIVRYAGFLSAGQRQGWCMVRYEDFVAGELASLERYLGRPVNHRPAIDPQYQRVARSCRSGNWRHWLTGDDVAALRGEFAPLMEGLGYDGDDWELAKGQRIEPAHSWEYVAKLVNERHSSLGLGLFVEPDWLQAVRAEWQATAQPSVQSVGATPCCLAADAGADGRRVGRLAHTARGQRAYAASTGSAVGEDAPVMRVRRSRNLDIQLLEQRYAVAYAGQAQRVVRIGTHDCAMSPFAAALEVLTFDELAEALPLPVESASVDALVVHADIAMADLLWLFMLEVLRVLAPAATVLLIVPRSSHEVSRERLADVLATQDSACRLLEWLEPTAVSDELVLVLGSESWSGVGLAQHYPEAHYAWSAPRRSAGEALRCNLCGSRAFGPGPGGRMGANGQPPRCLQCDSLERHRAVRHVLGKLPAGFLGECRLLQVGAATGAPASWFAGTDAVGVEGMDTQAWPPLAASQRYGVVLASHALEFVQDDRAGFDHLLALLVDDGWLMCVFSGVLERDTSADLAPPGPWHLYGRDVARRFDCADREIHVLEIELLDPGSGAQQAVHVYARDVQVARQMRRWLSMDGNCHVRVRTLPARPVVVDDPFAPLREELALWQESGRTCPLWWRDDDLVSPGPALDMMAQVATAARVPVLVAVIPALADARLGEATAGMAEMSFCQHGYQHRSHAAPGTPSSEFGADRPLEVVAQEISEGCLRLQRLFGERFTPIFVPPWNRIAVEAIPLLEQYRFRGLSQYPGEPSHPDAKLKLVNCHLDILQWSTAPNVMCQPTSILVARLVALLAERRIRATDPEPLGVLTHHRVMNEDAWVFMQTMFAVTAAFPVVRWLSASEIFPGEAKEAA